MRVSLIQRIFLCFSCFSLLIIPSFAADGKIVPRHSFQPPFQRTIVNWNTGAGAFVNQSYVRLTPAKQSRTGFVWSAFPCSLADWLVEFEFAVSGLRNLGGDGFAFWFVERSEMLGQVYGSTDYWTGLGIFFDTFNNDNIGSNPLISAVYNDGTQRYDYASDGASQALETCSFDFRNTNEPAAARIRYQNNRLTVEIAVSLGRDNEHRYQPCLSVDNLELGTDKYFGLTAHTGDVADNHDVISFNTYDLSASDADLAKIRASYQQTLTEQHSQPSHQEMEPKQFQHAVLTMLSQMQEEINLIQMTELHISDWIYTQEERNGGNGMAGVRPGGAAPDVPPAIGRGAANTDNQINQLNQLVQDQVNKLNTMSDSQSSVLREIKLISQSIAGMSLNGRDRDRSLPIQANSNAAAALDTKEITNQIKTSSDNVNAMARKVEDQFNALKAEIGRVTQSLNSLTSSSQSSGSGFQPSNSSSGDLGWISYLMLSFTTFCVASLTYHTFTQHFKNQRYKMI